ncbi:MAG: ATP synthase F1 subunit delta [Lachnospirales bacterium]
MAKLVDKRYANALFDLAVEENNVNLYYEQVKLMLYAFSENSELRKIMKHPHISKQNKLSIFKNSFGENLNEHIYGFLNIIFKKNRDEDLEDILHVFVERAEGSLGITTAEITTAVEISEERKNAVKEKIESKLNKKVNMKCIIDKDIIGGLVVKVDGIILDGSISNKLQSMKKALY